MASVAATALIHIALFCVACFALLGCVEAVASNASAPINSSFVIPLADYEVQTTLIDILISSNSTFTLQFGSLPGQSNPHSLGISHSASSLLVWFTYRDHNPGLYDNVGGASTSLQLQPDGDLVISVDGGTDVLIWHTSTSNKGVRSMELRDDGNLVLLNSSNGIVWQSFDHPTDTLLSTQKLLVGSSLLVSATNNYPFQGWNLLAMEPNRLVSYVMYSDSEPYWELKAPDDTTELAYAAIANASISIFDRNGNLVASRGNASSGDGEGIPNLQRFVLGIDGNMKLFEYDNTTQQWVPQMQVIIEACALPDDCGYYGVCVPGQGCTCPLNFQQIVTINGCVPPRALVCNSKHGNDFVRIAAASYFATNISSTGAANLSLKECQDLCTRNCSCLGFFYGVAKGSTAKGSCLITNQMRTLTASVYGNYSEDYMYDAYVRVQGKARSPLAIILGVCIPVAAIIACLILWRFIRHKVKEAHAEEEEFLLGALPGLPHRYSYRELKIATNNFSKKMGGGSFGSVYEGELGDRSKIAVKRLEGMSQGKKEFHAEVATIGTVRHLNLVRLRGFCLERKQRLLVYEYMGRGSLDTLLFPKEQSSVEKLSWPDRLAIAIGVAKGLAYLHEGCPDCIIHCDIKPDNILVGDDGAAKLSDFGLAKLKSREVSFVETNVRGTRGYMAPEWVRSYGQISEKADVYSFGVVMLELLSGRRNYEPKAGSSMGYLPEWALRNLSSGGEGKVAAILDNQIIGDKDPAAKKALMVALLCLQDDPTMRPTMGRVVRMLEGDMDVPPAPPSAPSRHNSSSEFSLRSFDMDRSASIEATMPFFQRASRYFFGSSTVNSTSARNTVASSVN